MVGPVVMGNATTSPILLIGQAPGDKEGSAGKPFAWTAGKTLFKWFDSIGLSESQFRNRVYMAAVCRCFPGKNPKGGDRVPSKTEIANCRRWLDREIELLQPKLLLPVGKLAISQFLDVDKLADIIGKQHRLGLSHGDTDLIPLPHPSGASTWHRTEPGKSLLAQALNLIRLHPAWQVLSD
ncbi:uracil-DNA glycosylase [Candidatus Thiodiazotropha endoloripes]|uniref:Uracil-DNA glycosylase n=2 Tax=Candidatus Thiodiazotropha endoloripes TaxID=1818881 RepID=A0A1E2UV85_9GAMM|nr:uracil-DNA glycosylase [Candidatus Thiodiazotropha endoloripes]ODB91818.1 uracil-DNA glycosylase [Candidatus Thiodiazotropha endoloripes]ODB94235.1 uracil-DNA glycosylase [Candidatus Thiodiazotropha endoloripes]ODB98475.1 uracil-DNA glycosylase [Candidatus Thiodiazotropha endoloripes]